MAPFLIFGWQEIQSLLQYYKMKVSLLSKFF